MLAIISYTYEGGREISKGNYHKFTHNPNFHTYVCQNFACFKDWGFYAFYHLAIYSIEEEMGEVEK